MIKKIVAIGPESTGKSMICQQLAQHFNTAWCAEYAREFLTTNGMNYKYADLLKIAQGQIALEETGLHALEQSTAGRQTPYFIDTDMYVMKVWCEFVFGDCHRYILDQIAERKYDLYLLCNIDLPWVKDELREYPDLESRRKLYSIYKDLMINQDTPWVDISGGYEERLAKAIASVNKIL